MIATSTNVDSATTALQGIAASFGWAIAPAHVINTHTFTVVQYPISSHQINNEQATVTTAFTAVRNELTALMTQLANDGLADTELHALLEVHRLMLDDPLLYDATLNYIANEHVNAAWALSQQVQRLVVSFEDMTDNYLSERALDVRQLGQRILSHLLTTQRSVWTYPPTLKTDQPVIVVAQDLAPACFTQWQPMMLAGLITELGGQSSHTAILARSHNIPAVLGIADAVNRIHDGDMLALNGSTGELWINPSPTQLIDLYTQQSAWKMQHLAAQAQHQHPPVTICGQRISVLGNIEQSTDTLALLAAGLDGVGLFRTEFLFMGRNTLPSEEEQLQAYIQVVQVLAGKPVTIRTIDVGADKLLNFSHAQDTADTPNPALGLRAVRYCLAHPKLFLTQLRAILRAASYGPIKLLIPMIASVDEIQNCKELLTQATQALEQQGIPHGKVELGVMIEIPAAAIAIDTLLPHIDFCSIGTNDLIQYTLAIDRSDAAVANLYNPAHPAIAALLRQVFTACAKANKSVSVCGEMAGDAHYTHALLDWGLRSFSLNPSQANAVKTAIRQWRSPL